MTNTQLSPVQPLAATGGSGPPSDEENEANEARSNRYQTVIQPSRGWIGIDWRELVRQRELLLFLIWRDIKVRYKQAALGVGWAVFQPIINMIVFTAIFGRALGLGSDLKNIPYAVFVFAGLLPWQLFATAISTGGLSLVAQQNIVAKTYFPRLFVPTAPVGGAVVDMGISAVVFVILVAFKGGIHFSFALLLLPALLALSLMLALGMAYLLSALTVTYRDIRFLIPFIVQIWMYASWVGFPPPGTIRDSHKWQIIMLCNPMHGIISSYRRVLFGANPAFDFRPMYLVSAIVISLAIFTLGLFYFRRTEKRFADIA